MRLLELFRGTTGDIEWYSPKGAKVTLGDTTVLVTAQGGNNDSYMLGFNVRDRGSASPSEIFGAAVEAFRQFAEREKPREMVFVGATPRRSSIYRRLLNRWSNELPYDIEETNALGQEAFVLTRKDMALEEITDDDRRVFSCGSCMLLAWALHKHLGWDMVGLGIDFEEDGYPNDMAHLWLEKEGVAVDIFGVTSIPEMHNRWLSHDIADDAAIFDVEPWFVKGFLEDYNWGPQEADRAAVWRRASIIAKQLKGEIEQ